MSDKYGKSTDIAGQIFAQQPSGIGSAGIPLDLNTIQQNYASTFPMDLDFMDMLEKAADEEEFRMLGVKDAPTLEEAEEELTAAAKRLADFQAMKGSAYGLGTTEEGDQADQYFTRQAELQAELEQARNTYVALGGDPDPSLLSKLGQGALDLIGGAGQGFSDLITLGTGPEVAQTLLDPVSILLGGLGGTINYAESGKTTPVILGQTSSGMPVGLNIPDPRSLIEGGLGTLIPGAGSILSTAGAVGALSLGDEKDQDPTSGVGITPAGALTAAAATDDDDIVKVNEVVRGDDAIVTGVKDPVIKDVIDPNKVPITVDAGDAIGPAQEITGDFGPAIGPVQEVTGGGDGGGGEPPRDDPPKFFATVDGAPAFEETTKTRVTPAELAAILASERSETVKTGPALTAALAAAGGGGGGGGGGFTLPTDGQRVVQVDPQGVVDIDYLYDFAKGLDQVFDVDTDDDDDEFLRAAEGGQVKKFQSGGGIDPGLLALGVAGLGGLLLKDEDSGLNQPIGFQGSIPQYDAVRSIRPNAFDNTDRRPGSKGRRYFEGEQSADELYRPAAGLAALDAGGVDPVTTQDAPAQTATQPDNLQSALGPEGLNNLMNTIQSMFGGGGGGGLSSFTPGDSQTTVIQQPAQATFTPATTTTTTSQVPVSSPINDYLASLGFGTEQKQVTSDVIQNVLDQGFTLPELAGAFGTTEDILGQILGFAAGGMAMGMPNYLSGSTDGMADLVPATIGGTQPAALSDGEFVVPADVVSHLGNGNSDAGAKQLYAMMDRVRDERTGTTKQGPEINPMNMMPA